MKRTGIESFLTVACTNAPLFDFQRTSRRISAVRYAVFLASDLDQPSFAGKIGIVCIILKFRAQVNRFAGRIFQDDGNGLVEIQALAVELADAGSEAQS